MVPYTNSARNSFMDIRAIFSSRYTNVRCWETCYAKFYRSQSPDNIARADDLLKSGKLKPRDSTREIRR